MNFDGFFRNAKIPSIDVIPYLQRIGVGIQKPSLDYLKLIHRNHLLSIPFENLDIHYRRRIILDIQNIFQKVVFERRGGFCYELNGLLFHLLHALGFEVGLGAARPFVDDEYTDQLDHMIILVRINGSIHLCDVGFGNLFNTPKKMEIGLPQLDYNKFYRFDLDPDENWILKSSNDNSYFLPKYKLNPTPHGFIQFLARCNYHQDTMESPMKQQKLITQLFPEGRITLTDRMVTMNLFGSKSEIDVMNEDEFLFHLEDKFGINSKRLINQQFD